jgi:hypothetical protein
MINNFPDDIIFELGKRLEKTELLSLYAVCRRCRDVIVNLLRRRVTVTPKNLPEMLSFVAEDAHYARSIVSVYLKYNEECSWTPNSLSGGYRRYSTEDEDRVLRSTVISFSPFHRLFIWLFVC